MLCNGFEIPAIIELLCGQEAEFDHSAGYGYRCTACNAVVGSIGMPRQCATLYEMQDVVDKLRGKNAKH
jgi:hypothetical protein